MFFIVWGTKPVFKKLGFVADFCPICRGAQVFQLRQVSMARHLYYISLGGGRLVGHQRVCQQCGTAFDAKAEIYASVSPEPLPLGILTTRTFPNLDKAYEQRLALEQRIREQPGSLSVTDRKALIRAPFLMLSPRVEKRYASTHIDRDTGLWMLAVLAALFVVPAVVRRFSPDNTDAAVLAVLVGGIVVVGVQIARSNSRFLLREIYPLLAQNLKPLSPNESEISAVLAELKGLGHKLGGKAKLPDLMAALG